MYVRLNGLKNIFPFFEWGRNYDLNKAICDFVAGITVGLTLIPQSIAYASLAGLEPQYGLYSSLCGGIIYLFLGTIPELSIAPTALLSLLTYSYTKNVSFDNVRAAILLCFLSGCVEFLCGILHLGFLVDFVSTPVVAAFTSAGAITIASSQVKNLLGLKYEAESFFDIWKNVFEHIAELKLWDALLGFTCCTILLFMRKLKDYGSPLIGDDSVTKKIIWLLSVGRNALVVISCAFIAFILGKYEQKPFSLTDKVPSGWPSVAPPAFSLQQNNTTLNFIQMAYELEIGIVFIPLIAIIANVGIAKAFARGTVIDATQEMVSVGVCNIVGSFFGSYPVNASFSRAAVGGASGVKTPLAGFYTACLVFLAFSLLTPYFSFIPKPTLAAVIICAVIFMIELLIGSEIWKVYRIDLIPFIITLLSCLMIGIEMGIIIGILVDVLKMLFITSRPRVPNEEVNVSKHQNYLKFTLDSSVLFSSAEHVRKVVLKECNKSSFQWITLDFSRVNIMDFTAVKCISCLVKDLQQNNKHVCFLNVPDTLKSTLTQLCSHQVKIFNAEQDVTNFFKDQYREDNESVTVVPIIDNTKL